MGRRPRLWEQRFEAQKSRLGESLGWFPYPFLIPVGLAVLVFVKSMIGVNHRYGNPADILSFDAQPAADGSIWISVTPIGREIVVTTADRQVFRWPQQLKGDQDLAPFVEYLKAKVSNEAESSALSKTASKYQTTAIIAADQRLKYLHLKPIIYALADARIRSYAFETKSTEHKVVHENGHAGESGVHD